MNLRWLVKQDGTRVLQVQMPRYDIVSMEWFDVPEVREEKDPIMTEQENSA